MGEARAAFRGIIRELRAAGLREEMRDGLKQAFRRNEATEDRLIAAREYAQAVKAVREHKACPISEKRALQQFKMDISRLLIREE